MMTSRWVYGPLAVVVTMMMWSCSTGGVSVGSSGIKTGTGSCAENPETEECECVGSPIVISLDGSPIRLTSSEAGVLFKLRNGRTGLWSWTEAGSNAAWLVLDRNGNGTIDDGSEMFGDNTLQSVSADPNGFLALAAYDTNHDGIISVNDDVWPILSVWKDANHDGISQAEELVNVRKAGIHGISLAYHTDGTVDQYGNEFRVAAPVIADAPVANIAYDVWLTSIAPDIHPVSGTTTGSTQWLCGALVLREDFRLDGPCPALQEPVVCAVAPNGLLTCPTKVLRYGQSPSMLGAAHNAQDAVIVANSPATNSECPRVYLMGFSVDPLPFPGGVEGGFFNTPLPNDVTYRCIQIEVAPPPPPDNTSCGV